MNRATVNAVHSLPADVLDALLTGGGDGDAVRALADVQLSRHVLMLREVLDLAAERDPDAAAAGYLRENFDALAAVDADLRPAVPEVLRHPYLGSWAMACLRQLAGTPPGMATAPHLAHLGSVALAAAMAARRPVTVHVPVRDGLVHVPGLGAFGVPMDARIVPVEYDGTDRLRVGSGAYARDVPADPRAADGGWLPLRTWTSGDGVTWVLDDGDPYRGSFLRNATPRLTDDEVKAWRDDLSTSWELLIARHPVAAGRLAAGLRVLTPLAPPSGGAETSAASRYAPGAIGMSRPSTPRRLAAGLVHEFAHLVLHGLSDVVPLVRPETPAETLLYSPWRRDPRPPTGVLFGVHAWLGVTAFWRAEALAGPGDTSAAFEWARGQEMLREGVRVLRASGTTTAAGHRVLDAGAELVGRPFVATVPERTVHLAEDVVADHALRWRLRHLVPDAVAVRELAARWAAGEPAIDVPGDTLVPAPAPDAGDETRAKRALALVAGEPGADDASDGDGALVTGDYATALERHEEAIRSEPDDVQAWSGAHVARLRLTGADWHEARPSLAREVFGALRRDGRSVRPGDVIVRSTGRTRE